ncbi:HAD-IIB family hydrolase [Pokkaliibacter sp. CJK22405]|uniref:HAD-IIB family hydrolase n=1 Tax=Pokkaliibacter sp. CJK22405 TaxID=3384615 RepID=UPI003984A98E
MQLPDNLMILTDLDGSLLDHHSYDWQPAAIWLDNLRTSGIPVIPNTSKTAAELATLREELGLEEMPCVVENGGLVLLPPSWRMMADPDQSSDGWTRIVLGASYERILEVLSTMKGRPGIDFTGFSEMGVSGVSETTGLPMDKARQAHAREASEPLLWHGDAKGLAMFQQALADQGLALTRGGRFYHVTGKTSKGVALVWLAGRFEQRFGQQPHTLAFGDGANDLPMLAAARTGVLIRGAVYQPDLPQTMDDPSRLYVTRAEGPAGWVEGVEYWLAHGLGVSQ